MSIYVTSDLHLSFSENIEKPMEVFGADWVNHAERLESFWRGTVSQNDTVIIAGDVSWALKLEDAEYDLKWIENLPGGKVFVKGNHDLWWVSLAKLKRVVGAGMHFIQNDFYEAEGYAVCGSRGWLCPGDENYSEQDEKIYKREILRLKASLTSAREAGFSKTIGVMHFPPANDKIGESGFTRLFEEFEVEKVFYGHLHGCDGFKNGIQGNIGGVDYKLVSLDYMGCRLHKIF